MHLRLLLILSILPAVVHAKTPLKPFRQLVAATESRPTPAAPALQTNLDDVSAQLAAFKSCLANCLEEEVAPIERLAGLLNLDTLRQESSSVLETLRTTSKNSARDALKPESLAALSAALRQSEHLSITLEAAVREHLITFRAALRSDVDGAAAPFHIPNPTDKLRDLREKLKAVRVSLVTEVAHLEADVSSLVQRAPTDPTVLLKLPKLKRQLGTARQIATQIQTLPADFAQIAAGIGRLQTVVASLGGSAETTGLAATAPRIQ